MARKKSDNPLDTLLSSYKGVLVSAAESPYQKAAVMRTESWGLQHIIGLPGFPIEQVVELYGPPDAGKTTLSYYLIRCAQRQFKKPALFVDAEGKTDLTYARACGVNTNPGWFYVARSQVAGQPMFGETALELVEAAVKSRAFSAVVLDSIGSLVMKAETEGRVGDANVGLEARIITRFVKRMLVYKTGSETAIILLNQVRAKFGQSFQAWGDNEDSSGGYALKHAGMRIRVSRGKKIQVGDNIVGYYVAVTAKKNSFGPAYRRAEIPLIYYKGVWPPLELLLTCKDLGLVRGNYNVILPETGEKIYLGRNMVESAKAIMGYRKELTPTVRKMLAEAENKIKMEVVE